MKFLILCSSLFFSIISSAQSWTGLWEGTWSSPDGYVFEFTLQLEDSSSNTVKGFFSWKFKKAPPNDTYYAGKENTEALEYINGKTLNTYSLTMEGYSKDDPNNIISLDRYTITCNEERTAFSGMSYYGGTWLGKIEGKRIPLP